MKEEDRRLETVISAVAEAFDVDQVALVSGHDRRATTESLRTARAIVAYLLHEDLKLSYPQIARAMGWRNHASARSASVTVEKMMAEQDDGPVFTVLSRLRDIVTQRLQLEIKPPGKHMSIKETP